MAKKLSKKALKKRRRRVRFLKRLMILVILSAAIIAGVIWIPPLFKQQKTTAMPESILDARMFEGTMVIAREESIRDTESNTTIEFVASEGSRLNRSDVICKVYSSGYNQTEINRLETYRDEIRNYHINQVFSSYVDAALENENSTIAELAAQVRVLVQDKAEGSLSNLEKQLTTELSARKSYLKAKYPDDQNLSELYKVENDQLKKIESWTTTYTATEECLVSFYTDGYERTINSERFSELTPNDVRNVIRGVAPEQSMVARGNVSIYRTVNPNVWYGLFLCQDKSFNPVRGLEYMIALEGFDDYRVTGVLDSFTQIGNDLLLRLRVSQDVAPVLNIRTCRARVGNSVEAYSVPEAAIYMPDGITKYVIVLVGGQQVAVEVHEEQDHPPGVRYVNPVLPNSPLNGQNPVLLLQ